MKQFADFLAENVKKMRAFNKPHQAVVAVNSSHIGDDNDYSCFLFGCVYKLFQAGEKITAYELYRTDPMLVNYDESFEYFEGLMIGYHQEKVKHEKEQAESWKFYAKD